VPATSVIAASIVATSVIATSVVTRTDITGTVVSARTVIAIAINRRGSNIRNSRRDVGRAHSNADANRSNTDTNYDTRCSERGTANQEQKSKQFRFH
jgi:hypothetical protein